MGKQSEAEKQSEDAAHETQVCQIEEKLVDALQQLEQSQRKVDQEVNAREGAELELSTLEEALGEEMNQLEDQCDALELDSQEANKRAAGLELELAEVKMRNKTTEKKTTQAVKELRRQLVREKDTREGLEKALEKQMSLGASTIQSPAAAAKKLKAGDFTQEADQLLRECSNKQLAGKLMENAQCKQQNDDLKQQLEMNQQRIIFADENNALLMKDMEQAQGALKENSELKNIKLTLECKVEELRDEVVVLNEDRETKARLLKEYITAKAEAPRARTDSTDKSDKSPKSSRGLRSNSRVAR